MAVPRARLPPEVAEDSSDLEFWRSESWVQLWSGQPLNLPPPGSAADLVRRALLPGSKVDFPQITEICDLVGGSFPQEGPEAIKVLVAAMRDKDVPFRKKLKALTITNEMLYDERAVLGFREMPGLQPALANLRAVKDSGLSEYVDENLRMLATEVDKVCFSESGGARGHASRLRNFGQSLQKNLEVAAGKLRGDVASPTSPRNAPVENTFYFDDRHQRWRQHGVPDGLDDIPSDQLAPGNGLGAASAPAASASSSGAALSDPFRSSGTAGSNGNDGGVPAAVNPFHAAAPPPSMPHAAVPSTGVSPFISASASSSGAALSDPFRSSGTAGSNGNDGGVPAAVNPFHAAAPPPSMPHAAVPSTGVSPFISAGPSGSTAGTGGPHINGFANAFDTDPNDFFRPGSGTAADPLAAFGPSEPKKEGLAALFD